jgi:hypothetical protein
VSAWAIERLWPPGLKGDCAPPAVEAIAAAIEAMPARHRPTVSDTMFVAAFLARWHHVDGQPITESVRQIATATVLSLRTVRRCLLALEAAELVTVGRRGGPGRGTERFLQLGPR